MVRALALALAGALTRLLYGVEPQDPLSFAVAGVALLATTPVAALLPACRAARVDPARVLRSD